MSGPTGLTPFVTTVFVPAALLGAGLLFRVIPVYSPWPPRPSTDPGSVPLEKQEA
ncbi:hypothetical protein [Rhodococcus tibetensis]|uniref:Uncharacterized protein n=1 Tax=Rhodococcus tibetensis TaxID=2965064 RepID=A0ABT1Q6S3_9NOCA|nr:hypothetical protein [Rhodococcus sp. FXJ9.536]MCQ4117951.1 hypothetical protein [Rhodococcus sp. FXJ9.536]